LNIYFLDVERREARVEREDIEEGIITEVDKRSNNKSRATTCTKAKL
jgi:hypothetical protein